MKTKRLSFFNLALAVLLVLSLFSAALPQPAQAANCDSYYIVKSGDTTTSIAQLFGIKWKEIARANHIPKPYKLKIGQRLCIPPKDEDSNSDDDTTFNLSVSANHNSIFITLTKLSVDTAAFRIRVRNPQGAGGGWSNLGKMKAEEKTTNRMTVTIPPELKNALYLQVCLKDQTTDDLTCRTVIHP